MPPRAVIFDLDGTLVDSLPGIAAALNASLSELGLPTHPESTVRHFIGNGAWKLCERGLPADSTISTISADTVQAGFRRHYDLNWRSGTPPFAGVQDMLTQLLARDLPLAVLSNKPDHATKAIVAELFPDIPFQPVFGQRDGVEKKPHPAAALETAELLGLDPSEITFVGDSTVDIETAQNAGMPAIAVTWGYHDPAPLQATGAPLVTTVPKLTQALLG